MVVVTLAKMLMVVAVMVVEAVVRRGQQMLRLTVLRWTGKERLATQTCLHCPRTTF
jgi:cbb3-type cytochrome oxidase cytochrome c subunit